MHDALTDLRRTRRTRRLGDVEWFDLAYRVYLVALLGGGAVVVLSGYVGDEPVTGADLARVFDDGPTVLGTVVAIAVFLGLRSGADGGPLAIEPADVRHVLLAPIDRRRALARPLIQRMRAVAFAAALAGGIAGQLAAQRLPGSPVAWAASGALGAGAVGVLFVAVATITHALRVARPLATAIGVLIVGVQLAAVAADVSGPADTFGSLAMWGAEQHPIDLSALAVTAVVAGVAAVLVGRLRVDPLVRRGDLVSQLRFAVTMQDLRTVVLLRRQLRNELPRSRPWPGTAGRRRSRFDHPAFAGWHRGARGISRTPAARIVRMAATAAVAGLAVVAVVRGTTPALVVLALGLFLLGLDAIEPLSQEIDHPGRTDGLPVERGALHLWLLTAPAAWLVPFALVGAGVVAALEPGTTAAAFALAVPVTWVGAAGSVVNAVRDSSPTAATESVLVPPEFAGFGNAVKVLIPLVVSAVSAVAVLAVREQPGAGTVLRMVLLSVLVVAALGWWVRRRDDWRRSVQAFLAAGRPS
jgi:hypothetical protein